MSNQLPSLIANRVEPRHLWIVALSIAALVLAASPALANSEYPPGLFENSPVVPGGPPGAADPGTPDAAGTDDYCASIAGRTFHNLEEVKRAHARCDPDRNPGPAVSPDGPGGQ